MLEQAEKILKAQKAAYSDIARTWLYLSGILEWYNDFNSVRNTEYGQFGIMPPLSGEEPMDRLILPASTGIQGDNPAGSACVMDALAITGKTKPEIVQMSSKRQKDAFRYRSAFSRAACIRHAEFTEMQISGTAAIDEQGYSLYPGDFRSQALHTLENVEHLLEQENASLKDLCSATVFLKRSEDASEYWKILSELGLKDLPAVCMVADICRDELLFEIDGIAAISRK